MGRKGPNGDSRGDHRSWKRKKARLYEVQAGHCFYCTRPKPIEEMSLDHVIPHSSGGMHYEENLVVACLPCNNRRGTMSVIQMLKLTAGGQPPPNNVVRYLREVRPPMLKQPLHENPSPPKPSPPRKPLTFNPFHSIGSQSATYSAEARDDHNSLVG